MRKIGGSVRPESNHTTSRQLVNTNAEENVPRIFPPTSSK